VMGRRFLWRPDSGVTIIEAPFGFSETEEFRDSPVAQVYASGSALRRRLVDDAAADLPMLRELRAEGQSIVIVEESSRRALDFVDRACVIKLGTKVLEDRASTMKEDNRLVEAYFGIDPGIDPEQTAL